MDIAPDAANERQVLNIAGYRFAPLAGLERLRADLEHAARDAGLLGTLLLAEEGINLMLAGPAAGVEALLGQVRRVPGLGDFAARRSWSRTLPFGQLRVKIRREIVALKRPDIRPDIRPDRQSAPRLQPLELKAWLDEGRPLILLDTRNRFEVEQGSFTQALDLGLGAFSELPQVLGPNLDRLRGAPVVSFCTGGIRCEKAAPLLIEQGLAPVYQLDGGILGYFEACGSAHFSGRCFVFDRRVSLDAALAPQSDPPA